MKKVLLLVLLVNAACQPLVPEKIKTESEVSPIRIEDSTQTIKHEIGISLETQTLFADACRAEGVDAGLQAALLESYVTECTADKTLELIEALEQLIPQQTGAQ